MLQFSSQRKGGGSALGQDLGQLGGTPKILVVLAGVVVAAAIGIVAMMLASG